MGKHHILISVHALKQMLGVMVIGFAHHEDSADLCATDVKKQLPTPVQWNLFCPTMRADVFVFSIPT